MLKELEDVGGASATNCFRCYGGESAYRVV